MATLPTEDEKIRMVLDIFKHFGTRPNEVLMPGNLLAHATKNGWRSEDISDGLKKGADKGYFVDGPNGTIKLTDAGFAKVRNA